MVIGAPGEDSSTGGIGGDQSNNNALGSGAVYVYTYDENQVWTFQNYIKASNTDAEDAFGSSVAISGDTLVVGAPGEDSNATGFNGDQLDDSATDAGAAYVYIRDSSGQWFPEAYLKASNTDAGDEFGGAVSISGETIVIGAINEHSASTGVNSNQVDNTAAEAGAGYVFVRSGSSWSQQAYLKPSNTDAGDRFGTAVDIDNDFIIVGSRLESSDGSSSSDNSALSAGAAYVFVRDGSVWSEDAYLKANNAQSGDAFGAAVAIDGDRVAVGAELEDDLLDDLTDSGAVYLYERNNGSWEFTHYLKAENKDSEDRFGVSVSLDQGQLAVGAWLEDSASAEVNGNQGDNSLVNSGAAYVFEEIGDNWLQRYYLKSNVPDLSDQFGTAIGASNGLVAVAAKAEDSSAIGVGGDASDDAAFNSGAVYVYDASRLVVGGTVADALGSGLVLSLNDDELLPITSNGSFEFELRLPTGSAYQVTVKSSPSSPEQSCSVANASGFIGDEDIDDIQVTCVTGFTIGGTVSGAAGPGLVLQNNGQDDLVITSNGAFEFSTPVADGAPYKATVSSEPTSPPQRCTVSDGAGTVQGQDVTDIQVDCENVYSIGGTVSGLVGSGLVLENNEGNPLQVSADGSFEFSESLASGEFYAVGVRRAPSAPRQLCQVSNGTGTVQNQSIANIQIDCLSGYTIGGTVTGVAGQGLVLRNNGGNNLFISENGPFEFSRARLDGSNYEVTIAATSNNPPQTCEISNETGMVQGQDVTDIVVECITGYRIGGSVSGLQGPGLVLQNNDSDGLPITANGSFVFSQPLLSGEVYDVAVLSEPESPEQICRVENGLGTIESSDVATVLVQCRRARYIGGTVNGLIGSGLVLDLNKEYLLSVTANGSFEFEQAIPNGADYDVTVAVQPTSPNQICTVINGEGSASGSDVMTIEVDCTDDETLFRDRFEG